MISLRKLHIHMKLNGLGGSMGEIQDHLYATPNERFVHQRPDCRFVGREFPGSTEEQVKGSVVHGLDLNSHFPLDRLPVGPAVSRHALNHCHKSPSQRRLQDHSERKEETKGFPQSTPRLGARGKQEQAQARGAK
jgi:hypothetical protein